MVKKSLFSIAALTCFLTAVVTAASCGKPCSPSLDKTISLDGADFKTIELPQPKTLDLGVDGVRGLRFYNGNLYATASNGGDILYVFSHDGGELKGSFLKKGRGPSELLSVPNCSSFCFDGSGNDAVIRFNDHNSRRLLKFDVAGSLASGEAVMSEIGKIGGKNDITSVMVLSDDSYIGKRLTMNGDCQERYVVSNGEEYATEDMKKLNSVHMDAPDGAYNFNVFSGFFGYSRRRSMICEAMLFLKSIHVYSLDGKSEGFTIFYGGGPADVNVLGKDLVRYLGGQYLGVSANERFFAAMYGASMRSSMIQIYSWEGKPLGKIELGYEASNFDIDAEAGDLITYNSSEEIVRFYHVPELATF